MNEHTPGRTRPPLTGLIAGALVVLGVLLWMFVSKSLLFVAGFGAFGPGLLRELGWLNDIASGIGEFNPNTSFLETVQGLLAGAGLIAAFFVPAWTARRWPRPTGALLLLLSIGSLLLFGGKSALSWSTVVLTNTLLAGPLIVTGLALIREGGATGSRLDLGKGE